MSIFGTILEKLGIKKPAAPATAAPAAPPRPGTAGTKATMDEQANRPAPSMHVAVPMVDVMSKLDNMAGKNSGLDWKVSIVDLLKLLKMDSSLTARKELATELGCPADLMGDSAKMNTWLHKAVLKKIAENGGNIPQSLLH